MTRAKVGTVEEARAALFAHVSNLTAVLRCDSSAPVDWAGLQAHIDRLLDAKGREERAKCHGALDEALNSGDGSYRP